MSEGLPYLDFFHFLLDQAKDNFSSFFEIVRKSKTLSYERKCILFDFLYKKNTAKFLIHVKIFSPSNYLIDEDLAKFLFYHDMDKFLGDDEMYKLFFLCKDIKFTEDLKVRCIKRHIVILEDRLTRFCKISSLDYHSYFKNKEKFIYLLDSNLCSFHVYEQVILKNLTTLGSMSPYVYFERTDIVDMFEAYFKKLNEKTSQVDVNSYTVEQNYLLIRKIDQTESMKENYKRIVDAFLSKKVNPYVNSMLPIEI